MQPDVQKLYEQIHSILETDGGDALLSAVSDARAADIAEVMDLLDDDQRSRLIYAMPPRLTAEVVIELDEAVRDEIVEDLDEHQLGEIVTELPPDDAADMIGELSADQFDEVLENVPIEHSNQITELLAYEEDTAGGIMNPRLLSLREGETVGEAIEAVRRFVTDEEIHFVYIVDGANSLRGVVPLRNLVVNTPETRLVDVCDPEPITVVVDDDQESVLNVMRKYDVAAVPVVDSEGVLRGRITYDDVMDVASEEADEDIYRMAGTDAAELETHSSVHAAQVRMAWLIPCIFGTLAVAGVIALFRESSLSAEQLTALLMFHAMIAATSGNAGIQTSTIILRGFATGELSATKMGYVFSREVRISILVGLLCAVMTGLLAGTLVAVMRSYAFDMVMFDGLGAVRVGVAVGLGMLCAVAESSLLGIALPFAFRRFGVDPAIASGPLITSFNDLISVTVYLGIAILVLT